MKRHNHSMKSYVPEPDITKVIQLPHKSQHRSPSAWINPQGLLVLDLDKNHLIALKHSLNNEAHGLFLSGDEVGSESWHRCREQRKAIEALLDAIIEAEKERA